MTALPYLTAELPGTGGALKTEIDDFQVVELPAYAPSGEGAHTFLWIEKWDLGTEEAVRRIARHFGLGPKDVGYAGRKDRRARTRQFLSVPELDPARAEGLELPGLRVLEAKRHGNKLRTGHLRGNRFRICLRALEVELAVAVARAEAVLEALSQRGLPNFFGAQRFGAAGGNAQKARDLLRRGRLMRNRDGRFLLSALQSEIFNACLADRLDRGELDQALAGDLMRKRETGGLFHCEDPALERTRVAEGEIDPTGPIFGAKMRAAKAEAHTHEIAALEAAGLSLEAFAKLGKRAPGTRRPLRVPIGEARVTVDDAEAAMWLEFELPAGSYATVLLGEVMKTG